MTDATGRKVDFRNTVIVMTSNVGTRRIGRSITAGFQPANAKNEYDKMKDRVVEEVKRLFNPEFLNRIDEILVFHQLSHEQLLRIVDIQVREVIERLAEKGLNLSLSDDAREFLVRVGSDPQYGARPLRRAVQQYIEDPLSELLLKGNFETGSTIEVYPSQEEEKLAFAPVVPAAEGVTT